MEGRGGVVGPFIRVLFLVGPGHVSFYFFFLSVFIIIECIQCNPMSLYMKNIHPVYSN